MFRPIAPVRRRDGKAVIHWPDFWLLQGVILGVQMIGVVLVALFAIDPYRKGLLIFMAAIIVLNEYLFIKRTAELMAGDPEDLPDADHPESGG